MIRLLRGSLLVLLPLAVIAGSLLLGPRGSVSFSESAAWLWAVITGAVPLDRRDLISTVVFDIRLPRVLITFLVGASLAASGAGLQAIFRNPLVDPYIMGISSGAAFGAALAIASGFLPIQPTAFLLGAVAVLLSYSFALFHRTTSTVTLILSGMIVSGVFTAGLTIVQFLSDPFKLQTIVHWTMGSLHTASWDKLRSIALPATAGVAVLALWRWRLNLLAIGDEEAQASGVRPRRERLVVLLAATVATSACVAVAGVVGFFGLFLPHTVRLLVGSDNRKVMPASIAGGGIFLVLLDDLARTVTRSELPIGVFTMFLGAPFFILLMKRARVGWEE